MAIGHELIRERLSSDLPPVVLLQGPRSVGKWTVGLEALEEHGVEGHRLRTYEALTVDKAREIVAFFSTRTPGGCKGVLARLDDATPSAADVLLKTLEEPPAGVHVVLVASQPPLLTVASRAQVFRMGYLKDAELAGVIQALTGISLAEAEAIGRRAGGQVDRAREIVKIEDGKQPVLSALKAAADGNEEMFFGAVSGKVANEAKSDRFGVQQLKLLRRWAVEAKTRRWRVFTPAESYGLQLDGLVIERVLRVTSQQVRPKLAVRAALLPVVYERSRHG